MSNSKYAGEFEIVLEKKNDKTVISEKRFDGLIKLSPTIHLDSEKISTYFICLSMLYEISSFSCIDFNIINCSHLFIHLI